MRDATPRPHDMKHAGFVRRTTPCSLLQSPALLKRRLVTSPPQLLQRLDAKNSSKITTTASSPSARRKACIGARTCPFITLWLDQPPRPTIVPLGPLPVTVLQASTMAFALNLCTRKCHFLNPCSTPNWRSQSRCARCHLIPSNYVAELDVLKLGHWHRRLAYSTCLSLRSL